jgi:hypothetical protein
LWSNCAGGAGNFSSLLQYLEKSQDSADVQFWKRLADPVLIHDPFCSFIWLLFCLPLPFPANGAPFTALVHLFYLVCVTQVFIPSQESFLFILLSKLCMLQHFNLFLIFLCWVLASSG